MVNTCSIWCETYSFESNCSSKSKPNKIVYFRCSNIPNKALQNAKNVYWWPQMNAHIRNAVDGCHSLISDSIWRLVLAASYDLLLFYQINFTDIQCVLCVLFIKPSKTLNITSEKTIFFTSFRRLKILKLRIFPIQEWTTLPEISQKFVVKSCLESVDWSRKLIYWKLDFFNCTKFLEFGVIQ